MTSSRSYTCPVCGFEELDEPAYDSYGYPTFNICPCCGTEFGYDDAKKQHAQLRDNWINNGMTWWSVRNPPPYYWDPKSQIDKLMNNKGD